MHTKDFILISPYSKRLRNGAEHNPKDYPYWPDVIKLLDMEVAQIGVTGEKKLCDVCFFDLSLDAVAELVKECACWAAVDNFLPHLAHLVGKRGVAIFGKSDPLIFGHPENINLLKDRKYLRSLQFDIWERETFDPAAFVGPEEVAKSIREVIQNG